LRGKVQAKTRVQAAKEINIYAYFVFQSEECEEMTCCKTEEGE